MLEFDPQDPYPLLPPGGCSHSEAQVHAAEVDAWLGLETEKIEKQLQAGFVHSEDGVVRQFWIGLPVQSLLTPYVEIREMLAQLDPKPGQTLVDLGAGYGRIGFVLGRHYPGVRFVGYEVVRERVGEGQRCLARWNYPGIELQEADLGTPDFIPMSADYYFVYDFGTRVAIDKCLEDVRRIAQKRSIVVVGRGRSSRDAIEHDHPWLSQIVRPRHCGNYSIYRSG